MQVKSNAEISPSISYHLSLRSLLCQILIGCLTQGLLYNCWAKYNICVSVFRVSTLLFLARTLTYYCEKERGKKDTKNLVCTVNQEKQTKRNNLHVMV